MGRKKVRFKLDDDNSLLFSLDQPRRIKDDWRGTDLFTNDRRAVELNLGKGIPIQTRPLIRLGEAPTIKTPKLDLPNTTLDDLYKKNLLMGSRNLGLSGHMPNDLQLRSNRIQSNIPSYSYNELPWARSASTESWQAASQARSQERSLTEALWEFLFFLAGLAVVIWVLNVVVQAALQTMYKVHIQLVALLSGGFGALLFWFLKFMFGEALERAAHIMFKKGREQIRGWFGESPKPEEKENS